jgi:putative thioredoxin
MTEIKIMTKEILIEVNDNNFREKVLEKSKDIPVIVDFWADWCMPCLMLSPILDSLSEEYDGKFILAKANVDDVQITAEKYNVRGIPAVKMFKEGKIIDEFTGAIPEESIREWIDKNL